MSIRTPEEVKVRAMIAAQEDLRCHTENGVDLNPFSTLSAREDWRRGFENLGPRSYERSVFYNDIYQRGRAAAELLAARAEGVK